MRRKPQERRAKMLKNKKFQAILSLLIAIGLWVYVMGTVDPTWHSQALAAKPQVAA